jgi:hypothetical protein
MTAQTDPAQDTPDIPLQNTIKLNGIINLRATFTDLLGEERQ